MITAIAMSALNLGSVRDISIVFLALSVIVGVLFGNLSRVHGKPHEPAKA